MTVISIREYEFSMSKPKSIFHTPRIK